MTTPLDRRSLLRALGAGAAGLALGRDPLLAGARSRAYTGPNVVVVRFGGGARRRETIVPAHSYAPFLCHELAARGTLFTDMRIDAGEGSETGHGQGTLRILTGRYEKYADVGGRLLGERFEPRSPTIFEYLRKAFDVPEHETLIVNGEDRIDEEFYTFSNHHQYGVTYRSRVLSLYRFKTWLLGRQLEEGVFADEVVPDKQRELEEMLSLDLRTRITRRPAPQLDRFWESWRTHYGDSGLVNPRGDELLTELTLRAMKHLRPRLVMVNFQDCDYVHWGYESHYTRGIAKMDQGLRRLVEFTEADEFYRDDTVFVVVPDCGRDSNRMLAVPFQHHFGARSSREIFCLFAGSGVSKGRRVERQVDQAEVAATVGGLMGFVAEHAEGVALEEAFA